MINSTTSSDRTARAEPVLAPAPKAAATVTAKDNFSATNTAGLRTALAAQPEIRPEVVARGKVLAADPSYPSTSILRAVGGTILNSPDLSEDAS
jgi:hypothetical protein